MPYAGGDVNQNHVAMQAHADHVAAVTRQITDLIQGAIDQQNQLSQFWASPAAKEEWVKVQSDWTGQTEHMNAVLGGAGNTVVDIIHETKGTDRKAAMNFQMPSAR